MKILIYGAGTIGCTYGWQLSKAGCEITLIVKKGKKKQIEKNGINIHCIDYRNKQKKTEQIVFRPNVIEELCPQNDFEYIIVPTASASLDDILPVLSESTENAHILFFQNIWDDFEKISAYLYTEKYFFGFPFMAGGGKLNDDSINSIISGSKYSKTMLGEMNGEITPRLQKIVSVMDKAGMNPFISDQIINWLVPHSAFIAVLSASVIKTGGTILSFLKKSENVKDAVKAIREAFEVCSQKGINPRKEKVNKLYCMPLLICVPIMKKIFSNEDMSLMFGKYLEHGKSEVMKTLNDVLEDGNKYNIAMPYLEKLLQP